MNFTDLSELVDELNYMLAPGQYHIKVEVEKDGWLRAYLYFRGISPTCHELTSLLTLDGMHDRLDAYRDGVAVGKRLPRKKGRNGVD